METIHVLSKHNYRDYRLWRPNTETPYYLYTSVYRPYRETLYKDTVYI